MGFVPHPNSYYYLVAVHSGKVLEVANASKEDGALIQQGEAKGYTDSEHQQFSFNWNAESVWVLRARHSERVIDVQNASQDDAATVQQWAWHGVDHERFYMIDAGDGTFFLQALHSGKVLEVYGAEQAAGKPVKQFHNHHDGKNLHQRFRPVLAEEGFAPAQLPGFTNPSQMMRELTLGIAGLIPEAGGAIKGVVSLFWPTDTASMVWKQVLRYIETYVENKFEELNVSTLRNAIEGARKNLREFARLNPGSEKFNKLDSTLTDLNSADRKFLDPASGERTLSYLVTMGTIKLTALQEQARNSAAIANIPVDTNQASHSLSLTEGIAEYTNAAQRVSARALKDRLDKIGHQFEFTPSLVTLRDGGDGTVTWYRYRVLHPNDDDKKAAMRYLYDGRRATVETQFGAQLDAIIAPALLWYSFDPANPRPQTRTVRGSTGPYGNATTAVDMTGSQAIGKIEVWGDATLIRGLRITGRDGTAKLVGYERGTHKEITLAAGELVAGAYGSAQFNLHSLVLETTFGQRLEAGGLYSGLIFHADLPPELNARLVGITASADAESVASIQFHWEYVLTGTWPPKSFLLAALPEGYVLSEDAT